MSLKPPREAVNIGSRMQSLVAEFLEDVLADGPLGVSRLEELARAAKHLGERQPISQSKAFRAAKKSLRIRSVRDGFGAGKWLWQLPGARPPTANPAGKLPDGSEEEAPPKRRVPSEWVEGVGRLEYRSPPHDVPMHRWRLFLGDCNSFLKENWAGRAAELGWNALSLFGCSPNRPLVHRDTVGLLWFVSGGRLVELHRDWAVVELAENGSRRVFDRRRVDPGKVILPWNEHASGQARCDPAGSG
jgi:hypothetical protein